MTIVLELTKMNIALFIIIEKSQTWSAQFQAKHIEVEKAKGHVFTEAIKHTPTLNDYKKESNLAHHSQGSYVYNGSFYLCI
jgi:hypothetical protein